MSWTLAFVAGLLFIIVSSPAIYKLTNGIFAPLGLRTADANGKGSNFGVILHAIVYVLLLKLSYKFFK